MVQEKGSEAGKVETRQKSPPGLYSKKTTKIARRSLMQSKYDIREENEQEGEHVSQELAQLLEGFLSPLLLVLERLLDKRLVRT